jgi:hypothetical protein
VPDGLAGRLDDGDAIEALDELEQAVQDAFQREVRPQLFLIEIELGGALLFGPIANLPRVQPAPLSLPPRMR